MYLSFVTSCCYPFGFPVCLCLVVWKHGCDMLTNLYTFDQGCIQPFVSGGVLYGTVRGPSSGRVEARSAERGGISGRVSPTPQGWGSGMSPLEKFWWCNLVQSGALGQEIAGSQNIAIMFDSGIDTVAYYIKLYSPKGRTHSIQYTIWTRKPSWRCQTRAT